ncbi:helix-turn-helix domain-containing protein [Parasphaerochaeta coccoides]|uniref:helix-turn-helix domain-containing protein n=1 Tax=Parasphaerochaeta coccoides TaxID=273376 RepID=UPI0003083CCC|nr:AraC family transcriptional regulator [Parasphaerochaeta coccoides]
MLARKPIITLSIVIAICISSLIVSQSWFLRQMQNYVLEKNMTVLELTQTIVDSYIVQTQKLAQLLLLNKNMTRFIYQGKISEGSSEIQTIIDAQAQLPATRSVNPMLEEVYVYSRFSGYLMNSRNAIFDIDRMYALIEFQDMNSGQWQSKYLRSGGTDSFHPTVIATVDGQKKRIIPYIQSFPLSNPLENAGKLMFLLNADLLEELLSGLEIGNRGRYCITDSDNTIIISNGDIMWNYTDMSDGQYDIIGHDGVRYLISIVSSAESRLRFFSALPYKELQATQIPVWGIFSLSAIIALIICCCIILVSAYTHQKNWSRLKAMLSDGQTFPNNVTYEKVYETIKSITEQQAENEAHGGKIPFMTETFFRRLIHGKNITPEEVNDMMERTGQGFPIGSDMVVAMAKIIWHNVYEASSLDDLDFSRIVAAKEAERIFNKNYYLYMDLELNIWLLLWDENRNLLNKNITAFWLAFKKITPYETSISISHVNHTVSTMQGAPHECNLTAHSIINENLRNTIRRYSDLTERGDSAFFDKESEQALISNCMKQDEYAVRILLQKIHDTNFMQRKLPPDQILLLFKALYNTALMYCQKVNITSLPRHFTLFSEVSEFFLSLTGDAFRSKPDREKEMISSITSYIHEHFHDPDLTLVTMSVAFKQRENYLYYFMKTRMDTSFSQYLEEYRLKQAKEKLFTDSEKNINEIAFSCGYANPQTFRRAFTKRFGLLPSNYRMGFITDAQNNES